MLGWLRRRSAPPELPDALWERTLRAYPFLAERSPEEHAKLRALAIGKTTTITLKLTKKQLKALKGAKKKGVPITISGAELTITATLVAGK